MFFDEFKAWQKELTRYPFDQFSEIHVERALSHHRLDEFDFLALLSPAARPYLEQMALKAHRLTLQNFGKSILLFTPLYLANFCSNQCIYCSYNIKNEIVRRKLSFTEVEVEGKAIAAMGLQHLLLLTGESRKASSPEYIADCAKVLRPYFASLGIEVYPLEIKEYHTLYEAGIDTLTIYQEVYDEDIYASVHLAGPKRVHRYRLEAPERACEAGFSGVTIGALLGLGEWRKEAFFTGLHAAYLQRTYPEVEVAVSAPRMRPHVGSYQPLYPIGDAELVQILLAYRLFLQRAGITLSTRESAAMRDSLLPLGITKLSAGSLTSVGGYAETTETGSAQFEISDERSVEDVVKMLRTKGYQPVFCDWVNLRDKRDA
ncbi:tyrosine lyase ThiH [Desulfosporosinus acidiphilus SJ4]|uniref:Tyrosine lyase ThiH n=1 Tax=Desulfosporosinus acidiphilus (strain DSM 22704 / JCM 16185 / SJ4) TaxID=646529 RepID=I4D6L0_DESAJ|nr:2-iminoacetate synthase ThiH [Desulfosporosinus acidiphilus]AFM41434.1 tyrosine lyase ThiH [Desulfosporosinus acidiphilus SJ4]